LDPASAAYNLGSSGPASASTPLQERRLLAPGNSDGLPGRNGWCHSFSATENGAEHAKGGINRYS